MEKLIIDGKEVYINTDEVTPEETGIFVPRENKKLEDTMKLKPIDNEKLLEDTLTDIWGDKNE